MPGCIGAGAPGWVPICIVGNGPACIPGQTAGGGGGVGLLRSLRATAVRSRVSKGPA